jgi:hypothetical protein
MLGFKEIAALTSAIGLLAFRPGTTLLSADPRELHGSGISFASTFQGDDTDGQTLVWASEASGSNAGLVLRIVQLSSALSSAESVWPVRATLIMRDSTGASTESKLYGIIDWKKQELRLHGNGDEGTRLGSSVTATGTFSHFDVSGTVDVLPLTASR